jgi:hypothetical protein
MNIKPADLLTGLFFAGLIIGTGVMQTQLKNGVQVYMLLFGVVTLASLVAKQPFKTSIPFYILLGAMLYVNSFIMTNVLVDILNPDDGQFVDTTTGERHRVMQMNWVWGVLAGFVLTPLALIIYHKSQRNKVLEISLTAIFILVTAIIYIINEVL